MRAAFFVCFSMQRIIIQENTSLAPLSIFTRREQLLSIICFQTGDLVDPHILHPVIRFLFGTKKNKKSVLTFPVPPAPLIHVQPFQDI